MLDGVHILGIRHHGPGSARSLVAALEQIEPQIILLEGPPDAQEVILDAANPEMRPPVALLIYRPDRPKHAVFYPFAEFSPELQAIRFAARHNTPLRLMDLPQRHRMASQEEDGMDQDVSETADEEQDEDPVAADPLEMIAGAAGYADSERWWEEQIETRHDVEVFGAVLELMTALREAHGGKPKPMEERREAWMRQTLRQAQKEGFSRIAVVCGAWHGPALKTLPTAKSDAEKLKSLPKANVSVTWMPWSYPRLTFASGYGAGIRSPGYYQHLWNHAHRPDLAGRWMTRVAHLLRNEDLESSTASIIEATRLADAAAALRGRRLPGLDEFNEAAQAVFCFGSSAPMELIARRLIVGDALGTVPDTARQAPLQRDLQKEQKRLRLPPEALDRDLELDLRKPHDLDRSRLLHRLRLLNVQWGKPVNTSGKGTFKEGWKLRWEPEHDVALIEAAPWGNTVEEAATRFTIDQAKRSTGLAELTGLTEILLLAELPEAIEPVMLCLENLAALTSDVSHLMNALPPMVNIVRYGNVRQTGTEMVAHLVNGIVARICAGLWPACSALNDEAAAGRFDQIVRTGQSLQMLASETLSASWNKALQHLASDASLHGLISGRATRMLLDARILSLEETAAAFGRNLSRGNAPAQAVAWLDGFLRGSGLVLIHQRDFWNLIDDWLCSLSTEHFTETLPLLRRTFSSFPLGERRQMAGLAGKAPTASKGASAELDANVERANLVLPVLGMLLGFQVQNPEPEIRE